MALYRKRKAGASSSSGEFPEYGAIFMSNASTKEECLRRNIFGLPLSSAHFVKAVRSGMVLFLFEYEHRILYGVFEAISDGQLNIVRHAYRSSSSKSFPAQVRVRVIWDCRPLAEEDFRDAISDNYYEKYKFNFGLSRQQVQRLLWLFDSKRMGLEKPLLKDKAKKRHISNDGANLVTSSGIATSYLPTWHSGSYDMISSEIESNTETASGLGDLLSVSGSKQVSVDEQVKCVGVCTTCSMVLEDYIPLSSPDCFDTEVNVNVRSRVKALYSDTSEERRSVFSRLNKGLQSVAQENDRNSMPVEGLSRQFVYSDLLPRFVHQKEERTLETDLPVNKILENLEQRHDKWKISSERDHIKASVRASVFSRLSFT